MVKFMKKSQKVPCIVRVHDMLQTIFTYILHWCSLQNVMTQFVFINVILFMRKKLSSMGKFSRDEPPPSPFNSAVTEVRRMIKTSLLHFPVIIESYPHQKVRDI